MPSQEATCGRNGCITPAVSGVPNAPHGGEIESSYSAPAVSGVPNNQHRDKIIGDGYCRLQMALRLALGVRGTVAGHRLGALDGGDWHKALALEGEGYLPHF